LHEGSIRRAIKNATIRLAQKTENLKAGQKRAQMTLKQVKNR